MAKLEDRESIVNTLPHLLWHAIRILKKEQFWFAESRKRVRRYVTAGVRNGSESPGPFRLQF